MTTKINGATKGAIVGLGLFVGVATGGIFASDVTPASASASGCTVVAGRAGALPCTNPYANTPDSRMARTVVGRTATGALLGLFTGGPGGAFYGGLGGAASVIPWA